MQVAAGGVSGLTAIALILGALVARLTTSTKESTVVVLAGVTIAGAFVGGLVAAPYLNRHHHRLSRTAAPSPHPEGSAPELLEPFSSS